MNKYPILLLVALCSCGGLISAAEAPFATYPEKFRTYLQALHGSSSMTSRFDKESHTDIDAWRSEGRSKLRHLIGLDTLEKQLKHFTPDVALEDPVEMDGYTRRKGFITTEPGVRMPFWMLTPNRSASPNEKFPLAICAHGHDRKGMDTYAGVWQDEDHRKLGLSRGGPVGVQAVRRGFVTLVPATRGLSDAFSLPDIKGRHGKRDCRAQLIHALLAGRTAIGERVWDTQKILDWALKRSELDADRVLLLGNSGGGVLTLYTAAVDERITVAVPSCSFTSLTSADGYIFHCDCCLVPRIQNEFGDLTDVGGLISPRALLAVHGKRDGLHHYDDVERAMAHVESIFQAAKVPGKFEHVWGNEGHQFYPELMWPFIEQWTQK